MYIYNIWLSLVSFFCSKFLPGGWGGVPATPAGQCREAFGVVQGFHGRITPPVAFGTHTISVEKNLRNKEPHRSILQGIRRKREDQPCLAQDSDAKHVHCLWASKLCQALIWVWRNLTTWLRRKNSANRDTQYIKKLFTIYLPKEHPISSLLHPLRPGHVVVVVRAACGGWTRPAAQRRWCAWPALEPGHEENGQEKEWFWKGRW